MHSVTWPTRSGVLKSAGFVRIALTVALLGSVAGAARAEPDDDQQWAKEIVLRPGRLVGAAQTGTERWEAAPTVTVVNGTLARRKAVAAAVGQLNAVLKGTPLKEIKVLQPGDPAATLVVEFMPRRQFPARIQEIGSTPDEVAEVKKLRPIVQSVNSGGRNRRPGVIGRGLLLASSDAADARDLGRYVLFGLCQNLGLTNTSARKKDSVFYADRDGNGGETAELSGDDRKLIRWYYTHVPANTTDIAELFADHWPKDE